MLIINNLLKPELKIKANQRRRNSLHLRTASLKIEQKLLHNKQIRTKLLTKVVVISDKSTHILYKGNIVQCQYIIN